MLRKAEGREPGATGSAVFPCRLAGDKCPRHYSLTMHINLGLAFPAHLCSMFQRLRKQLVASHELLPRASVYSNALANYERMGPCWSGGVLPWQLQARYLTLWILRGRGRCHHQPLSGKGSVLGWPGFSWGWKLGKPQQLLGILLGPACPGTRLKTFAGRQPADVEPGTAGGDVRDHL